MHPTRTAGTAAFRRFQMAGAGRANNVPRSACTNSTHAKVASCFALSDVGSRTPARVEMPFVERALTVANPTLPVEPMSRTGLVVEEEAMVDCLDGEQPIVDGRLARGAGVMWLCSLCWHLLRVFLFFGRAPPSSPPGDRHRPETANSPENLVFNSVDHIPVCKSSVDHIKRFF